MPTTRVRAHTRRGRPVREHTRRFYGYIRYHPKAIGIKRAVVGPYPTAQAADEAARRRTPPKGYYMAFIVVDTRIE